MLRKENFTSKEQDNCGVFGIYADHPCVEDIYQGIDFLQHRGQEYCGMATFDGHINQVTHHGKVGNTFSEDALRRLKCWDGTRPTDMLFSH